MSLDEKQIAEYNAQLNSLSQGRGLIDFNTPYMSEPDMRPAALNNELPANIEQEETNIPFLSTSTNTKVAPMQDLSLALNDDGKDLDAVSTFNVERLNAYKKYRANKEEALLEAQKISAATNIPENLILSSAETFADAKQIYEAQQKNVDYEKLFAENRALAKLAKEGNSTMAAVAMHHVPEIKEQKSIIEYFTNGLEVGRLNNELRLMGDTERHGGADIDVNRVLEIQKRLQEIKAPSFADAPVGAVVGGVASQAGQLFRSSLKGLERGIQYSAAGAMTAGAVAAPTLVGIGPAALAGARVGFGAGMKAGYFEGSYDEMAGANYLQLRMEKDANGQPKYTKDQANAIACAQAAASASIETFTMNSVMGILGNTKGIYASQIKDIVANAASKESAYAALGQWLKDKGLEVGKVTWHESKEEAAQSVFDDVIRDVSDWLLSKDISVGAKDIVKNAIENFVEALPTSFGFGLIGLGSATTSRLVRNTSRALQMQSDIQMNQEKNALGIELITRLRETIASSDFFKKDAKTATDILKKNLEGSGFEHVYIDTQELRRDGKTELLQQVVNGLDISDETKQNIIEGKEELKTYVGMETFCQLGIPKDSKINDYISFDASAFSFAKNKRYAEIMKADIEALKKLDIEDKQAIENIIIESGFAAEDQEAAREYLQKYGLAYARKEVGKRHRVVSNLINEIIDRNGPHSQTILNDKSTYYTDSTGLHKGLGYYTNPYDNNTIVDENFLGSDVIEELKTYDWHPYEAKTEPGWLQTWRNNHGGKAISQAEQRQLIIDNILGKENGGIWDYAPENLEKDRADLTTLLAEQQQLENLLRGFGNIVNNEDIVARGLSKEGYQVYKNIMEQLKKAPDEARDSAQLNAILLARHADRYAEIVRDLTGKPYTAIDYINDYVVVDAEGKNVKEGGLNQFDVRRRGILTISDFLKRVLEELDKPPKKEGTKAKGNPIRWTHDSGVIFTMEQLLHARKKHKLTDAEIADIGNNIGNLSNVRISKKQKGRFHGISYLAKIKGENGTYGVALEVSAKGEIYFKTAFNERESFYGKGEKGIDNWIKKESTEGLTGSIFNSAAASVSPTLSPTIVVQNSPNVKKNLNLFTLYQRAWHGSPYRFTKFDLGAIGSGEGNQAHGWGLYFADDREVGENYKDVLSENLGASSVPSLYEVEIPSIDDMLLEFETITYQQDGRILEAAKKLVPEKYWNRFDDMDGRDLYRLLKKLYGGAKAASLALNSVGVKGIFYEGLRDGDCYVVFDDKAIEIIETYNQAANGQISFAGQKAIISLFSTADQSTFAHEAGHLFLRDLERLAAMDGIPEQVVKDYETVKNWINYNSKQIEEYRGTSLYSYYDADGNLKKGEFLIRHEQIQAAIKNKDTELAEKLKYEWAQERWARGWEEYLRQGKAPTSSLQRVFRAFKEWLTGIYKDFLSVGGAPTGEVKQVMDRMLATQQEIDFQAKRSSHYSFIRAGGLNFLAADNQELFEKYWEQAKEEAKEKVLKIAIKDIKDDYAKQREETINDIRESIVEDADNNTVLTISRMVAEEPASLGYLLEVSKLTEQEYQKELERLGGSYDAYIKNELAVQVEELDRMSTITEENIKAMAAVYIENGEYSDKLYEFEVAAMVQKGAIEERIGKMADKKFAEIEKALSGIDANEEAPKKISALQQRINDLMYTIRWNEAEKNMLLDIQKALAKHQVEVQKEIDAQKLKAVREKDAETLKAAREAAAKRLKEKTDALKEKLGKAVADFSTYRKEQLEGLRVVRDAEKGWIGYARKMINHVLTTDYSIKKLGSERKHKSEALSHRYESGRLMAKGQWYDAAMEKRAEVLSSIEAEFVRRAEKIIDKIEGDLKKKLKTLKKNNHIAARQRYLYQSLMVSLGYLEDQEIPMPSEFTTPNNLLMEMALNGYEMEFFDSEGIPYAERDDNGNIVNINLPEYLQRALNGQKVEPKDLTLRQLQDLHGFMKMLYKSGSKQMITDKDGRKVEVDALCVAIRAEANSRMQKIQEVGQGKANQEETKRQWYSRIARKLNANILQTETVLEMMGPLAHQVYDIINDASMKELRMLGETNEELKDIFENTIKRNSAKFLNGKYHFGNEVLSGSSLLSIALNCGTVTNKERVRSSFNVTDEQISEALSNLGRDEWVFVEGIWKMFDSNWPAYAQTQIDITGGMAKKEVAEPFTIMGKDGNEYKIAGGYYPIRYDSKQGTRARQMQDANDIRGASMTAAGKNIGTGATNERAKKVSDLVLSTDLGLISSMLTEQVHFITMRKAYLDARAIVYNKEFKNAVIEQFGGDMQAVMEEWVESQWANSKREGFWDTAGRYARTSLTLGALSYRITTALINVANIATVTTYLGPKNTLLAIQGFYGRGMFREQYRNEIFAKSPFLAQRAEVFDTNIRENIRKQIGTSKWNKMTEGAKSVMMAGFKPIMLTDMMLALPAWQFEYERVLREADPTKKTAEQIEADAIRAGDKAVRKCFGSGMKQDINSFQRGSEFTKTLTTFYSYFAVVHNMMVSKVAEGRRAEYQGGGFVDKWAPIANGILCEYIAQSLIDSAVRQAMDCIGDDDWDWEKFWKKSATNVADNMFGAIPVFRDWIPRMLADMLGERANDVRIPIIDIGYKFQNMGKDIFNPKKDYIDIAYDCTKLISVLTGLPDTLLNAVPTTVRFFNEFEKQNSFEYLKSVLLDRRLKSKK